MTVRKAAVWSSVVFGGGSRLSGLWRFGRNSIISREWAIEAHRSNMRMRCGLVASRRPAWVGTAILVVFAGFLSYPAAAEDAQDRIRDLLIKHKSWTMHLEYTNALTPSDHAQRFVWEFAKEG